MKARSCEYSSEFEKAFNYYQEAKKRGSRLAIHALGAYYENGYFVKKDIEQAHQHYLLAAKLHSTSALNALGRLQ